MIRFKQIIFIIYIGLFAGSLVAKTNEQAHDTISSSNQDDLSRNYSKSKVDKYLSSSTILDPIEGMYKYKLTFPEGREVISGDVGIIRLNTDKYMAFFYKSWADSIPDGIWGFIDRSAEPDLFYGDWTFGGKAVNTEFKREGNVIKFAGYFQDDRINCQLIKMYPASAPIPTRRD